ncbi:MAG: T9SS type A sorting domain-containing protein, partial [Bacteroidota bacterium]
GSVVAKLNQNGAIEWSKGFLSPIEGSPEYGTGLVASDDGSLLYSKYSASSNTEGLIYGFDNAGIELFSSAIEVGSDDQLFGLLDQTDANRYLMYSISSEINIPHRVGLMTIGPNGELPCGSSTSEEVVDEISIPSENIDLSIAEGMISEPSSDNIEIALTNIDFEFSENCSFVLSNDSEIESPFFNLYPNPTSGAINIDMPDQKWDLLRILDIHGRLIKVLPNSGNLNISELENGIYLIQLEGQFGTTIGRLVKH